MGVYVRPDSPYYWLLLERPDGEPIRESTGIPIQAYTAEIKKQLKQEAQDVYALRMAALARDDFDLPARGVKKTIAFYTYAKWFKTHHLARRRGAERDGYALDRLCDFFDNLDLSLIDRPRVQEFITERLKDGVKASTINREVDVLKGMLREAIPKYLKASPLKGLKKLRTVSPEKHIVSLEDEPRLLEAIKNPIEQAFYIVAVDSLIRLSNVINLKWSEVKAGHLDITDSKTGAYRVPLSDRARQALAGLTRKGEYVFPHRRKAKKARDVRGAIRRLLERACARCEPPIKYGRGVGITFHTATRATGATRMLRAGFDPRTVQAVGNWKDFRAMQGYLQPDSAAMQAAVNAIAPPVVTPQSREVETPKKRQRKSAKTRST